MATQRSTVDFILDQADGAGAVSARRMFGEYALSCDGRTVALIGDDRLFLKPTEAGRRALGTAVQEGFPYPGAK
ncbi:MAG: TfoX/Sxy family protein [Methylobacterium sp.]|uniref:TfoX/Sxy family protein n=1 Tax=Methylobacterium sp. TaxID=409 RepID=UPI00258C7825|nr:TfoX/Sxy family protein [Methylobacterium sp.]MBY0299690.1 TfoX/Sxy family protein [Methylobacterium sp.]